VLTSVREPYLQVQHEHVLGMEPRSGFIEVDLRRSEMPRATFAAGEMGLGPRHVELWVGTAEREGLILKLGGQMNMPPRLEVDFVFFRRDLEIAKRVQEASFPQQPPAIPGLSCATFYKPAHSVGGDYYDFLRLQDGAWGIAIGDVSGKGLGAALVMAGLQASLRAQTLYLRSDLETLFSNLNRLVCESSPVHFFASLFYGEYQPETRILRYVNAGHNPPIVLRRNDDGCEILLLKPGSVPVGAFEGTQYTSETFQLEIRDVLVAYTDGITESENCVGDLFGQERLERILCGYPGRDSQEILRHILDELSAYSTGCSQRDDIALVVMQVQSRAAISWTCIDV
jgi:sigma-B regulation protein RsbU (phosphoserine phosphatase)